MTIPLTVAVLAATALAPAAAATGRPPACPLVFGHGGYPKNPGAAAKDLIRQPNHPSGVEDMRARGADGVEADVQLTRDGTKAVMWHNTTTNGLTGPNRKITDLWWAAGDGDLSSRRISRGPYTGERVHTLSEWLDHARAAGLIALLEVKRQAKPILERSGEAWHELSGPILERQDTQRILLYSTDPWIQGELAERHPGLLRGSAVRWTDGVGWDEPPPGWRAQTPRWTKTLSRRPAGVLTDYPADYRRWLAGRCV
ncbi:glycerophosphodiester phosphodiesterase [Nonomuraea sp. SBT364]|uniref:glycerophosphodiester phosphodiesterase n=1 Tax=Nonomuraea sp. SBT364 TaxID=1580530 RepID=UPI00066EC15C|nr:glycerophosphodiester phosphodiesterase family protein [Nonomuraea sp. SBT364]